MAQIIKCPHCGAEYLASEIFFPDDLLDKSYIIHKTSDGHIEHMTGEDADLIASYVCDYCDKEFVVTANVTFNAEKDSRADEYVTKIS